MSVSSGMVFLRRLWLHCSGSCGKLRQTEAKKAKLSEHRAGIRARKPSCHSEKSVCDQRKPIATDDLDPISFPHPGPRALSDRSPAPVVEPHRDHIVGFLFRVSLDLVAGICAGPCADDSGGGVTASRADLMAEHSAQDPAGDRPD